MRGSIVALCLACAPVGPAVTPQPPPPREPTVPARVERAAVERIRARVAEVDALIADGRARPSYWVLPDNAGDWRPVKTKAECEAFPGVDDATFPQDCAVRWRSARRTVRLKRTVQSRSGDLWREIEFTFWPEGRIAFRFEQLFPEICAVKDEALTPERCGEEARDYWDERGVHVRSLNDRWQQRAGKRGPAAEDLSFPGELGREEDFLPDLPDGR